LKEIMTGRRECDRSQPRENRKNQGRKTVKVSAGHRRHSLPCRLKPSVIRQICLPAVKGEKSREARVMYVNSKYGSDNNANFSQTDCHEPNCPKMRSQSEPKPKMRQSPATRERSQRNKRK
ncbi:hypothetical protein KR084_011608, partial [Drosophila pseudotakahashii]